MTEKGGVKADLQGREALHTKLGGQGLVVLISGVNL